MTSPEHDSPEPPTLQQVLQLVIEKKMRGFVVFGLNGEPGFEFCDLNEPLGFSDDQIRIPMSPEDARSMLEDLEENAPEALEECGRSIDDPQRSSLN